MFDRTVANLPEAVFERNVPVPTIDFGMRCLWERKIMLVFKATLRSIL